MKEKLVKQLIMHGVGYWLYSVNVLSNEYKSPYGFSTRV